jgi:histidine phosphotransferase ChpT
MNRADLAGLAASRLAHDLAGALGAIGGGAELMADEEDAGELRALARSIAEAARAATLRLRFWRLALGGATSGEPIPAAEARVALRDWLGGGVTLDWDVKAGMLPRARARALLCLAATAAEAMPAGGRMRMSDDAVEAQGPGVALPDPARRALAGDAPDALARQAPALIAAALAGAGGVGVEESVGRLRLALGPDQPSA